MDKQRLEQIVALAIERALGLEEAEKYVQGGELSKDVLLPVARAVAQLSRSFTERAEFQVGYLDELHYRKAYLLYYLPINVPKTWALLNELSAKPKLYLKGPIRVLDLGAGPGAATLGVLFHPLCGADIAEFFAVDRVTAVLADYEWIVSRLAQKLQRRHVIKTFAARLETVKFDGEFDIIILSNVINELARIKPRLVFDKVAEFLSLLSWQGSLLIVEPALKSAAIRLMKLRDALVEKCAVKIYSPCPAQSPCPMLATTDWCHSEVFWYRPRIVAQIDKLIGNRRDTLSFSYLIIRRDGHNLAELLSDAPLWRTVGKVHKQKGKSVCYCCGLGKYAPVVKLKREAADKSFEKLRRGEYLHFSFSERGAEVKIGAEDFFKSYGSYLVDEDMQDM
ncbi:MAG: small ribosomal subunit Rsm22 family protein [Acidobacteriota bacterium]|nr:small ribosomal subunit Rsm22 family protein [Blastocatellia bacterium]MDW8413029.1 small ribosomal subunit Rsm22 family protein [Acidobacteriota bacterium]